MANEPQKPPPRKEKKGDDQVEKPSAATGKKFAWRKLLTKRWLLTLVVVSLVLHALGFAYVRTRSAANRPVSPEVSLGTFRFAADEATGSGVTAAQFNLHISLLKVDDRVARAKLAANKFKVQQDIEELLRQAGGEDFVDPLLTELKRQLQEQINATIGMRSIAQVIITDLSIDRAAQQPLGIDDGNVEDTADRPLPASEEVDSG